MLIALLCCGLFSFGVLLCIDVAFCFVFSAFCGCFGYLLWHFTDLLCLGFTCLCLVSYSAGIYFVGLIYWCLLAGLFCFAGFVVFWLFT